MDRAEAEAIYEAGRDAVVEALLELSAAFEGKIAEQTAQIEEQAAAVAEQRARVEELVRAGRPGARQLALVVSR